MGLKPLWQEDVFLTVQGFFHQAQFASTEPYFVINCNGEVFIHLVPLDHQFSPQELIALQSAYQQKQALLVHLWEDVWLARRMQVLARISSFLQLNKGIHARKTKIEEIDRSATIAFLNANHLQGYVKAKYNFGLLDKDELVAVASFSETRPMKSKGENYQSAELVRFASRNGSTIIGGLSKLIKHFCQQVKINDLMTYADRDWSLGKGYDKLGFELTSITKPSIMYLDTQTLTRYFPHRLPKTITSAFEAQNQLNLDDFLSANGFVKLFNTGNLKYHLHL